MSAGNPTVIATLKASGGSASDFLPDDAIDLTYLTYSATDTVTLAANNVLDVFNSTGTLLTTVQLDSTTSYGSYDFAVGSDGKGGTEIVNPIFSDNFSATSIGTVSPTGGGDWVPNSIWNVTAGSVDLCGPGTSQTNYLDVSSKSSVEVTDPLSGLTNYNYVDLDGSTAVAGALTTKQTFAAGTYTLKFDLAGSQRASYNNGVGTTTVTLGNWSFTISNVPYNQALKEYTETVTTTGGTLTFAEQTVASTVSGANNNVGNLLTSVELLAVACYLHGTRLLTDKGEVAIECLKIGDLLVTASGKARPIRWLGRRSLDVARYAGDVADILPICVSAGAFGRNRPARDLWLSPGHNIAFEGVLMPISALQNGRSVVQHAAARVEYWHVELDEHDLILAEGLPAETYLDCGNRAAFENGAAFIEAHPDFKPKHWAQTCLPLVFDDASVHRARTVLLERLADLGHTLTSDADAHLLADDVRIDPIAITPTRLAFVIPPGRRRTALVSRAFVPAHMFADSRDERTLGLCVARLQIDGADVALDALGEGWQAAEPGQRWTNGSAALPAKTQLVIVDLAGVGCYGLAPRNNVVALFG
jgi:hypothetical protein